MNKQNERKNLFIPNNQCDIYNGFHLNAHCQPNSMIIYDNSDKSKTCSTATFQLLIQYAWLFINNPDLAKFINNTPSCKGFLDNEGKIIIIDDEGNFNDKFLGYGIPKSYPNRLINKDVINAIEKYYENQLKDIKTLKDFRQFLKNQKDNSFPNVLFYGLNGQQKIFTNNPLVKKFEQLSHIDPDYNPNEDDFLLLLSKSNPQGSGVDMNFVIYLNVDDKKMQVIKSKFISLLKKQKIISLK